MTLLVDHYSLRRLSREGIANPAVLSVAEPFGQAVAAPTWHRLLAEEPARAHQKEPFINIAHSHAHKIEAHAVLNAVGSIVITALALLSFYTLALSFLPRFESDLSVNFVLSPIIIVFFAAFFIPVIRRSGLPPAFFGFCLDNWRAALPLAAAVSLAFLAILMLLKWVLIATVPQLHGLELIGLAEIRIAGHEDSDTPWYWVALALYLFLTPVQEFVARCGIQAPLYAFLQGSELKRAGLSILVSNLVFSAVHAHIGLIFALLAFVPGLIWGWIFLRTNSWLAASASHLFVGGAAIFLFGIEELLQRLT